MLTGGFYDGTFALSDETITLNNLLTTQQYQVQLWVHRIQGANFSSISVDGVFLDADGSDNTGPGQYIVGSFTADATSQDITGFTGSNYGILTGVNVVAVPEPATITLLVAFGGALSFIRRKLTIS